MPSLFSAILSLCAAFILLLVAYFVHLVFISPRNNPLRKLPGPPSDRLLELRHMSLVME
ncbi:hypothetical protein PHLCEN_2v6979 [Hermanssonia centrifuga]|uniref:Uncharacterized protein n=1 Tax=Hermanssonia centrifuga TaxID=98765 RepID=A0A2R6NXZ4_9APHY|nr:hypothetical protein PHLCEN_2v6979 [Hermanssonia centrifuga]